MSKSFNTSAPSRKASHKNAFSLPLRGPKFQVSNMKLGEIKIDEAYEDSDIHD